MREETYANSEDELMRFMGRRSTIRDIFATPTVGHDYGAYHAARFNYVFGKCLHYRPAANIRVLDVGRGLLTLKLSQHYRSVTSLGFPLALPEREALANASSPGQIPSHIEFDLNKTIDVDHLDRNEKFDLIVFGETIEHLVAPPEAVLRFLRSLLSDDGIIICQTPNAVALHKRLKMLFGYNPYQRLRFEVFNPGHIREYTKQELIEVGEGAGLSVIEHEYRDYFGIEGSWARRSAVALSKAVSRIIPPLSRGQTIVYGKRVGSFAPAYPQAA